jgi:hypothetical protein
MGRNGDRRRFLERGWGFYAGFLVHGAPVERNWTARAVFLGGIVNRV